MRIRERLAEMLEAEKGHFVSGAELASRLGVTRAAVWKAVRSLQEAGYRIEAVPNRGYCLAWDTDVLSAAGVSRHLRRTLPLEVFDCVDSTNSVLRARAEAGAPEGSVVLAASQSAGRGRVGRSFFSPAGTGLYLSLLLRAQLDAQTAAFITPAAAIAVCEAIERVSPLEPQIKWVNDVFVGGKKACGILTEAAFGMEDGRLRYAVVGIGINVYTPPEGFPPELAGIAGSLFGRRQDDMRNRLAAAVLDAFLDRYAQGGGADFAEAYRRRCFVIGRRVSLIRGEQVRPALVLDVDEQCALLVRYDDGETERITAGEISLRL